MTVAGAGGQTAASSPFSLRNSAARCLHASLCRGRCWRWHSTPQYLTRWQPVQLLSLMLLVAVDWMPHEAHLVMSAGVRFNFIVIGGSYIHILAEKCQARRQYKKSHLLIRVSLDRTLLLNSTTSLSLLLAGDYYEGDLQKQ